MATALIIVRVSGTNRVWVQRRDGNTEAYPHLLTLFGGKVEDGEEPAQAGRRELTEETGIQAKDDVFNHVWSGPITLNDARVIDTHVYEALVGDVVVHAYEGAGAECHLLENLVERSDLAEIARLAIGQYRPHV